MRQIEAIVRTRLLVVGQDGGAGFREIISDLTSLLETIDTSGRVSVYQAGALGSLETLLLS